jgi:hypothetical protein
MIFMPTMVGKAGPIFSVQVGGVRVAGVRSKKRKHSYENLGSRSHLPMNGLHLSNPINAPMIFRDRPIKFMLMNGKVGRIFSAALIVAAGAQRSVSRCPT